MVGFDTGIAGVTTGTIGSNIARPPQKTIVTGVKRKPTLAPTAPRITSRNMGVSTDTNIGLLQPKKANSRVMSLLGLDLIENKKTSDQLIKEYQGKVSVDAFDKLLSLKSDILNGSGRDEVVGNDIYNSTLGQDAIDTIFVGYDLLKQSGELGDDGEMDVSEEDIGIGGEGTGIGTIAGIGGGALAGAGVGAYVAGKGLEKLGKGIYGAAFKENPLPISAGLRGKEIKGIRQTGLETPQIRGGENRIGKKAYEQMNKTWENEIVPNFNKNMKVTTVDDLIKSAKSNINKGNFSKIKKQQLLAEVDDWADGMKEIYPNGINQNQAHKLTVEMGQDLDAVYKKTSKGLAAVPVTNETKGAILSLRSSLRNKLYNSMSKVLGTSKPALKASFAKYGNLGAIVEASEKGLQQKLLGSALGLSSAIIKKAGTPLATVGGKLIYNIGKGLQYPLKKTIQVGNKILKVSGKGLKAISPTLKTLDPTGILINQIETEIKGRNLKGYQVNNFSALRLMGASIDEAVKEAEKTDPDKFTIYA